ncbi:FeoB-associated Cys-rich membrane protein [Sphingobacteruim zhuxiongii]|uniref:FeoB-associated Cys-rich membrane protein n=1 Tax=Sphingobacterium zhuxiongii TaxID=2662364 RepID=UPI00351D4434
MALDADTNPIYDGSCLPSGIDCVSNIKVMETSLIIQYIIIFLLFIGALYFIFRSFFPGKSKKNTAGCGKGCGCNLDV